MAGNTTTRYPQELKDRAVRMVAEMEDAFSEWAAMQKVAGLLGVATPETVRKWVRRSELDSGSGHGVQESAELKRLKRENAQLKRANAILRSASAFFRGRTRPARELVVKFITEHKNHRDSGGLRWGVESICAVFTEHGIKIAPSTYYEHQDGRVSRRQGRDELLREQILRVHGENYAVYGARKVWLQLNREGIRVARCTVEQLMKELGLRGALRGKVKRTTRADPKAARPGDLVQRRFALMAPDVLWVADFTYVSTWSGWVYVAFVIDAYARRILGWSASTVMNTQMVLNALNQALFTRQRAGSDLTGLIHHHDAGAQYTAVAFTDRLAEAGIQPSIGSVGDSYDNALAETINGLYKTELIKPGKPWRNLEEIEIATAEWVDWYNHHRLYEHCGDIPPAELEADPYAKTTAQQPVELTV
ncbi:IS3 family transposase [Acaricomes phytoseiuli]|uniref:IS3 family transposase n=2 Tax=Acaricomes phytoseiuli TaxID=291968 RepID=UPI002221A9BA|nr:IS3 family transposase [Acaricomes phytoseiuli]MCW1249434.1 IS3 family transposase [Acaricomes phytoseiuli]